MTTHTTTEPATNSTTHTVVEPAVNATLHLQLEPPGFGIMPFGDPTNLTGEIKAHIRGFGDPTTKHTENNEA